MENKDLKKEYKKLNNNIEKLSKIIANLKLEREDYEQIIKNKYEKIVDKTEEIQKLINNYNETIKLIKKAEQLFINLEEENKLKNIKMFNILNKKYIEINESIKKIEDKIKENVSIFRGTQENKEYIRDFKKNKLKFVNDYLRIIGLIIKFLYPKKDIVYLIFLSIGILFVFLKFIGLNNYIFIDNLNILNVLNISISIICFIFLCIIILCLLFFLIDIVFFPFLKIFELHKKNINYYTYWMFIRLITIFLTIIFLGLMSFGYINKLTKEKNNVTIKLINNKEEIKGELIYFSGENYIIIYTGALNNVKQKTISIPKENVEYIVYPITN